MTPVLSVRDLVVEIHGPGGLTRPVREVTLEVGRGEIVGVVGETGCGKTLTGLAVLGLLPPGAVVHGEIRLGDLEVGALSARELRGVRGAHVAMIFQNPGASFNPVNTIGEQFTRVIRTHRGGSRRAARDRARDLLREVELADTERVLSAYPHQLSGGMLQRAMIALALSCEPRLIIADEATTALDVTIARQVLQLLLRLQREHGFGVLFISHNLAEARDVCDRVYVLYAGQVVESGPTNRVFDSPQHPYTRALLAALPQLSGPRARLTAIPGAVPHRLVEVTGCVFANRCPYVEPRCETDVPRLRPIAPGQWAACHLIDGNHQAGGVA